jgi:hypothetical protein
MSRFPRIAIVGSRDYPSQHLVERFTYLIPRQWTIISGGARGVDKWAEETAKQWNRPIRVHKPQWGIYGKRAGFIRNNAIVRDSDIVVAFHHNNSRGTAHTISLAKYLSVPCIIVTCPESDIT